MLLYYISPVFLEPRKYSTYVILFDIILQVTETLWTQEKFISSSFLHIREFLAIDLHIRWFFFFLNSLIFLFIYIKFAVNLIFERMLK